MTLGDSESIVLDTLTLGEGASSSNTITDSRACLNYTQSDDQTKEGLELFVLSLKSEDPDVCLGQETTLVRIPPNGGMIAVLSEYMHVSMRSGLCI